MDVHADKTRWIESGRFAARNRGQLGEANPETFTFPGFTHAEIYRSIQVADSGWPVKKDIPPGFGHRIAWFSGSEEVVDKLRLAGGGRCESWEKSDLIEHLRSL